MIAALPHRYEARLEWDEGRVGHLSAPGRPAIVTGPPPQFDGSPNLWSPEELLLSAAASCFMTTFMTIAGRAGLPVAGLRCVAHGTLDRGEEGFVFTSLRIEARLRTAPAERERALTLLSTAKKHCIVSNALKTPVELDAEVVG